MELVTVSLPSGNPWPVRIDRKKMKTCRLKVYPDLSVSLSLPESAPDEWIEMYLAEKASWIEKKLEGFKKTTGYAATNEIRNGYSIQMLGKDMVFSVLSDAANQVYSEGRTIIIKTTDINDQKKLLCLFEKWWKNQLINLLTQRVDHWYPVIKKYGVEKPQIYVRKMKTLWGSCSVDRGAVTFNLYLLKAKVACIDYVVLHELTHFLYPNHSKQFYMFLSNYMPDWKDRKKVLDQDVVHGL